MSIDALRFPKRRVRSVSTDPAVAIAHKHMRRDLIEFAANLASLAVVLGSLVKQRRLKRKPMSVKTIAVIVAMEAEAAPLIEHLGLKKQEKSPFTGPLPAVVFSGAVGDATVHVCTNGPARGFGVDSVGTVPAALTAYQACEALKPDLLVNAGTAGGFKAKGGVVGDVYLATAFKNHDRRIQIPGFDVYGVGATDAAACPNLRAAMGFKTGVVSTGNSLDCPDVDRDALAANDASVKEMEAAGIAHVAVMFDTPFIAVKAITDIVDGDKPTHDEFLQNLGAAAKALQGAVPKVLEFVAGKKLAEL